ncbi:hypothetical protein [Macrococcoides caseolyticum]|uniref:hypothetical protein n=1 Tax=Macrococcoides caseolyticum TaxID=69966 RepID=UPI000C328F73|nr:hypothetical protein [Macrococcus caseolyticus]PKE10055.1 hypothetical protein CW685_11170 [Macrococcus caseolyticus]PKE46668.1 hypothetical protein CW677_11255 [Macrococcus caseolyticus]PKF13201.1 hypothetical protein CW690_11250 [Macrococcus caseolyticus]
MTRKYLSVRLAYETKYCAEFISQKVQEQLDILVGDKENKDMETNIREYLISRDDVLANTAITLVLKTGISTVIEQAFYQTANNSYKDWMEIEDLFNKYMDEKKIPTDIDVGTLSPRLYLEEDVIQGLERYQYEFKKPSMVRVYRLSNVIKLVIFASYLKINEV